MQGNSLGLWCRRRKHLTSCPAEFIAHRLRNTPHLPALTREGRDPRADPDVQPCWLRLYNLLYGLLGMEWAVANVRFF